MEQGPERTSLTVFQDNAQVRLFGAGSQEKNHIWMSDDFHDSTFVLELFQFVLLNNLFLDLFDSNYSVLPSASVNYTITTFWEFPVILQILVVDFIISLEDSSLID